MKRRVSFLVASASILVLAVAFSWHARPAAAAQGSATTVFMSTEAWYDETPPCVSLIDCSAAPATTVPLSLVAMLLLPRKSHLYDAWTIRNAAAMSIGALATGIRAVPSIAPPRLHRPATLGAHPPLG